MTDSPWLGSAVLTLDWLILAGYFAAMLGVGLYFMRANADADDYYVGGRRLGSVHIGLSVVATDVGGGFSIGLGGLGFTMGLSGSWMLLTGLVGAWLSAVFLVPRVRNAPLLADALTFPQVLGHVYGRRAALVAAVISAIGYAGFTASQLLAGAKLAGGTIDGLELNTALLIMGGVAVVYTVMGGLRAVIFTDTLQWAVLLAGLTFVGLPMAYLAVGGWGAIQATVAPEMLSLGNISATTFINWAVTIVPIWFVGMTLYQRIYASRDAETARRAWFIAGLLEWPLMAFLGVALGLLARVAAEQGLLAAMGPASAAAADPETGLPMLLRAVLPSGLLGIMLAAYFSAILSTADSCLMASSGNVVTDLLGDDGRSERSLRRSQLATLLIGLAALGLASLMTQVLDLMLLSYAFMVSGLFIPTLGALFTRSRSGAAAVTAMIVGGATTAGLYASELALPLELDGNVFGIAAAALCFALLSWLRPAPGDGAAPDEVVF